ncbi:MAG TPA: carbohydrate ABC transporter permease [Capsulimonadaceae bacterium]|nr:carbohydrate ABC transporter permease [Capsulimonadaceae bacterium]
MVAQASANRVVGRGALYLALTLLAVVFIFPFYWLVSAAFKNPAEIWATPPQWFPHPFILKNFVELFRETNIPRAFLNSVIISAGSVLLSLFLCSLGGYAFAKFPGAPGNSKLFTFVLGTLMIPAAVTLIPAFEVLIHLHLVNTYLALILPGAAGAFGIFWMRQYFSANLPDDLIYAARIDGCSEFGIYWRVALPVARPALAALGIIQLIGSWNNLMWAFIVLRTPDMLTLPVVIYLMQGEMRTPWGMLMAGGLLTVLPLVLAFLFFQKQFIAGITSGAIKQ